MNGYIFYLMAAQTVLILRRVLDFNYAGSVSDWFFILVFALYCRFSFPDLIFSPSPDVPVTLLILIATWLMVNIAANIGEANGGGASYPGNAVLILASGAVSFKLGAIPLLGVSVICYLLARGFSLRKAFAASAIVAPFAVIHAWVSTVTSGCPLYPTPYLCTDLPWSLGSENARNISASTFEFLKWVGPPPPDASSFNWLWHTPLNHNLYNDKPLMLGLLVANVLCGAWLYIRRNKINRIALIYTALVAFSGIGFTIFKLPHLRFGLGFFLVVPALTFASLLVNLSPLRIKGISDLNKIRIPLLLIAAYFTIMPMASAFYDSQFTFASPDAVNKYFADRAQGFAIWAREVVPPADGKIMKGNNFLYYRPTKSPLPNNPPLCWGAREPCAQEILSNVWLKDEKAGFSEGFIKR